MKETQRPELNPAGTFNATTAPWQDLSQLGSLFLHLTHYLLHALLQWQYDLGQGSEIATAITRGDRQDRTHLRGSNEAMHVKRSAQGLAHSSSL